MAPRLTEVRTVLLGPARGLDAVLRVMSDPYVLLSAETPEGDFQMYPQVTPAIFDSLIQHLPEPCRRLIVHDTANKYENDDEDEYEAEAWSDDEDEDDEQDEDETQTNAPYCQWLQGSWDAVLLPRYTQWMARATIYIDMLYGLPHPYQRPSPPHADRAARCETAVAAMGRAAATRP